MWTYVHFPEDDAKSADFTSSSWVVNVRPRRDACSACTKGSANFSTSQSTSSPHNLKVPNVTMTVDMFSFVFWFFWSTQLSTRIATHFHRSMNTYCHLMKMIMMKMMMMTAAMLTAMVTPIMGERVESSSSVGPTRIARKTQYRTIRGQVKIWNKPLHYYTNNAH